MRRTRLTFAAPALCAVALVLSWPGLAGVRAQAPAGDVARVDASFLTGLRWRNIGPNRGGRSIGVTGSTARPLEYYFGATGGGLWKTTDAGTTWKAVSDGHFQTSSVGAVAVAESQPDTVWVGMGEVQLRGNVIQGDGVYKSVDAGKTWKHMGLADSQAIARIRVHPTNPDTVYVAALGHTYGPNEERGVFRTRDGGATWKRVLYRNERAGAVDLSFDPANPSILYASLWEVFRTPHSLSSGGPGSGLFKTTDGGDTWTEVTRNPGLPRGVVGKIGVAPAPGGSGRVFAIVEAEDGGIFRSDDGGASWSRVNDERRFRQRAFYYTRIYTDPQDKDVIYVLNTGFYRSADAGKTWKTIRVPHGDNHDLWMAANDPRRMINGNDGGANVSFNGGESWTEQRYPTAQMYHVVTTAHVPYHVCGAQQDNSTACVPVDGSGATFYEVGGGESGYIAADPRNADVFFAGSYGGLLTRYDRATGASRAVTIWPENPMGHSSADIKERFQWTFPIVFSPSQPGVLYAASQHLWRTTTDGQSWDRISPDLTRADPATLGPSGGPITLDQTGVETYATIFTVAPSPIHAETIWAGSDDGVVSVTRDGGRQWARVTPPDLPDFARISLIEASRHSAGTAYVAANRYQRGDRSPYFYRTEDFGQSWRKIVGGIPANDFARAIREDRLRPGLLYAGTEHGVHVSFDSGDHWQTLRLNLPATPVHDIAVTANDVVIATHGRSFYVLDNVGVLRQLSPAIAASPIHLFTPQAGIRSVSRGIAIDYFLRDAADKASVEILDAGGQVIRRFTGTSEPAKQPEAGSVEDEPRPAEPTVAVKKGMNRFVWDMRHEGPSSFPKMILWAASNRGPRAIPGSYSVRLTVGGTVHTQPFELLPHPLLTRVTQADLQEQFRFALEIRDRVTRANDTVVRIRGLKEQVADRVARAKQPKITAAGEALITRLTGIEGEIYQYRNQSSQDPLNYPIKLNNKLAALMGVVDSGDGRPTEQSYEVFNDLTRRLEVELARLEALATTDLAAFNKVVRARNLPAITMTPRP